MTKTFTALIACGTLLLGSGCTSLTESIRQPVRPDPLIPHQIDEPMTAWVLVRKADRTFSRERITIDRGWWVASPLVVEPPQGRPKPGAKTKLWE
jgi:hypothetical protein